MLFNEPKLLKCEQSADVQESEPVSVLFNEPKLLKCEDYRIIFDRETSFSALQRAEIAEISGGGDVGQ